MSVNSAGTVLFLATPSGIRVFDLPQPDGVATSGVVSGFPAFREDWSIRSVHASDV